METRKLGTPRLVYGVGTNDADYVTEKRETVEVDNKQKRKLVWICPYYKAWRNMLHYGLYEAVQESYKGWSCEINTHKCGDCVNVHLMLKSDKVLASVGKYRVDMSEENFYRRMIGELK